MIHYGLRTCDKDLKSHNGFQWPESGYVEAPDWKPTNECGNGLHALLDGVGDYSLLSDDIDAKYLIVAIDDEKTEIIDLQGKVKFKCCEVVYCGNYAEAATKLNELIKIFEKPDTETSASGYGSQLAASGYGSRLAASGDGSRLAASGDGSRLAASGDGSQLAASGYGSRLAASGGGSQLAASGYGSRLAASRGGSRLVASGDGSQLAASGDGSVCMATNKNCIAKSGKNGSIVLTYHDDKRYRHVIGYIGEDGIEADTWYKVEDGKLVKA